MKLRFVSSLIIFLSAYSPLSIIFLIQDINFKKGALMNPEIVWTALGLSIISCIFLWASVSFIRASSPPITVRSVSNRSGELINYSMRWTPLSRQNLNFFKVEKYTSVLGQCPWFPAPGYGYPCTGGTGFGTRGLDEGVFHCRI